LDASSGEMNTRLDIRTEYFTGHGPDYVEIRIRDTGTGISRHIIDTMFEPYVTSKPKGTGLGLAIVRKIIEEHGGLVWLENNSDAAGACAIIRLPVNNAAQTGNINSLNHRDAV